MADLRRRLRLLEQLAVIHHERNQPQTIEVYPFGSAHIGPEPDNLPVGIHRVGTELVYIYSGDEPDPAMLEELHALAPNALMAIL